MKHLLKYIQKPALLTAVALCLFAGTTACSEESSLSGGDETPTLPEGTTALRISFNGIKKVNTYADLTPTEAESRIDTVQLLLFDGNKGDTLVAMYPVINPTAGQETIIPIREKSNAMKIVAIANPRNHVSKDWMPYIGIIKLSEYEAMTTNYEITEYPGTPLLMTAYSSPLTVDMSGSSSTTSFNLSRLVARVDIVNRDSVGVNHTFVLERARLVNAPTATYLMPNQSAGTDRRVGAPDGAPRLTNPEWVYLDGSDSSTGTMFSRIYAYADGDTLNNILPDTKLEIIGKYNGATAHYSIPFGRKQINTNNRYVVVLDSIRQNHLTANILMMDWDSDTIKFDPDESLKAPDVTFAVDITTGNKFYVSANGSSKVDTIVFNALSDSVHFDALLANTQPGFTTAAEWISVEEKTPLSYSALSFGTHYAIRATANTTEKVRKELIHFYNPINPVLRRSICFIQGISTAPIDPINPVPVQPEEVPEGTPSVTASSSTTGVTIDNPSKTISAPYTTTEGGYVASVSFAAVGENANSAFSIPNGINWLTDVTSYALTDNFSLSIARNNTYAERTSSVDIINEADITKKVTYTVTQSGAPKLPTVTNLSPAASGGVISVVADASTITLTVTDAVEHSVFASTQSWITVSGTPAESTASNGDKVRNITLSVTANTDISNTRSSTISFANATDNTQKVSYMVTQAARVVGGAPAVTATSSVATVDNSTKTITTAYTSTQSGYVAPVAFSATGSIVGSTFSIAEGGASWLTDVTSYAVTDAFNLSIARNNTYAERSSTVTVANQEDNTKTVTYTVTQAAAPKVPTVTNLSPAASGGEISVAADASTITLTVTDAVEHSTFASTESWITVSGTPTESTATNGDKVRNITLSVTANMDISNTRSSTVTFSNATHSTEKVSYTVTQAVRVVGGAPTVSATSSVATVDNSAKTITTAYTSTQSGYVAPVTFSATGSIVGSTFSIAEGGASWLTDVTSYAVTDAFNLSIARNNTYADRTSTVDIINEEDITKKVTYTVTQSGAPKLPTVTNLSPAAADGVIGVAADASTITLTVTDAVEHSTFTSTESWVTVSGTPVESTAANGDKVRTITLSVGANTDRNSRSSTVTFSNATDNTQKVSYTVSQEAGSSLPTGMPDWTDYQDKGTMNWTNAQTACPTGYRLPTANEYLAILPPTSTLGAWTQAGTTTTATETAGTNASAQTGPGYYIKGSTSYTLYGIKKAGTADAYVLEWIWATGAGKGLTIRMLPVGASFGTSATAAQIKSKLDGGGSAVTTLSFPNNYGSSTVAYYWSSTEGNFNNAWYLFAYSGYVHLDDSNYKSIAFGVRCLAN